MITIKEAYKKAAEVWDGEGEFDNCTEFENAYAFGSHKYDYCIGGEGMPVMVMKNSGRAVPMFMNGNDGINSGEIIGEIDIAEAKE